MGKRKKAKSLDPKQQNSPVSQAPAAEEEAVEIKPNPNEENNETIDVKIQSLSTDDNKTLPLVGYFPSGFDPFIKGSLEPEEEEPDKPQQQHRVRIYKHVDEKKNNRFQVVVSPNGSQVDFVGTSYSGEGAVPQLCTYALGVLDKATQTLKIVPITANKIFRLEPKIGESNGTEDEAEENLKKELNPEETDAERRRRTITKYSTKKTIRRSEKQLALDLKQDAEAQKDLAKTLDGIKINKDALEVDANAITNARNIPPHDMSASTPQNAYPLEKIISQGEWHYLQDVLECSQGAEVTPNVYPNFVCNRVYKLQRIKNEYEMNTLACVFSYIAHLIKYKEQHSMDGVSSAKSHIFPGIIVQKFREMFGESDSKRLSDEKKNLLISYVLVLTLFADDYQTDPSDIAKDLRMSIIDVRQHYNQLGCKFVKEKTSTLATLPVPLKFPEITARRKKRQR